MGYGKRAENAQTLLKHLYSKPYISVKMAVSILNVSHPTASSLIKKMVEDGILQEQTGFQRNQIFFFNRYLDLFMD